VTMRGPVCANESESVSETGSESVIECEWE
jgi:hypothetical protein